MKTTFTQGRPNFSKMEEEVLAFWDETDAFLKSVDQRLKEDAYVFYDGPPFANGLPHYGHLLGSTAKDVIPRYQTMKGKRVERIWGWDCHGVPVENAIEKELGLKGGKKGIEAIGIDKFNAACRNSIMIYDAQWKKTIKRLGRWVDFEHAYKTMDMPYMESVWWGFKQLYEKKLVYQGRKVILYCARCSTPLSNFEIAMDNSYREAQDWSVYVKFRVKRQAESVKKNQTTYPTYFIAWTTTPWTLPGNVALAVLPKAEYVLLEHLTDANEKEYYWVAKERLGYIQHVLNIKKPEIVQTVKGKQLDGIEYEPLYTYMPLDGKKAFYVTTADFVSLEDGSGVVHTAAIYGEDDYKLAQEKKLPCVPTLDDQGKFIDFVTPLAGQFYKKAEDWVVEDLRSRNLLLDARKFTHSYPFCYRCGTPLYYSARQAWFIDVQKMKKSMIKANKSINWFPGHLKEGRFGKGLETAPDWNISRSRYWGTPMPIWESREGKRRVIGSLEELKVWAVNPSKVEKLADIHREFLDDIEIWIDEEKTIKGRRIFEVFDCWVESGSMPFAQIHYPFENKEKFESAYPAQFITEYIAQTRAWFYCMHVISVGIFGSHAFENCLTTGTLQAEDGQKMSKSKKNYPDPLVLIDKYGSDCLRLYLMSSPIMRAENMNFSEKNVHELQNKVINILWNMYGFYALYGKKVKITNANYQLKVLHVLDRWLLSKLARITEAVTKTLDAYDLVSTTRILIEFSAEFSTWYVRLSRERLKEDKYPESKEILARSLVTLCKLFAPFIPFITETIYQGITQSNISIHLSKWPRFQDMQMFVDENLEKEMSEIKLVTEKAHAIRKEKGIKVRQPLQTVTVASPQKRPSDQVLAVLCAEINVKSVEWREEESLKVTLDTTLSDELLAEGDMRDVIRLIQDMRKADKTVKVGEMIDAWVSSWPREFETEIKIKACVRILSEGEPKIKKVLEESVILA